MASFWLLAYLAVMGLALVQAVLTTVQLWENRRFARSRLRELPFWWPAGRVAVFVPCKGVDVGLEENLRAVLHQDHPDYEVVFIVESEEDPAYQLILDLLEEPRRADARVVVAGLAEGCAQKVHNLRAATAVIPRQIQYLAFMDSDARPRPEWLRALVVRLGRPEVGAVTGYRWFVPAGTTLANQTLAAINGTIAAMCGPGGHYLVWGGSWAMRREVFDREAIRAAWDGRMVDDVVVSHLLARKGYDILFQPACMVPSPLDVNWPQLLAFIRRQYFLVRFHFPRWWVFAQFAIAWSNMALGLALAGVVAAVALKLLPLWLPLAATGALLGLHVGRALIRRDMARTYLPSQRSALRGAAWLDVLAGPCCGLVHWWGLLRSGWGREITWRGIRYRVLPGGTSVQLTRPAQAIPLRPTTAAPATPMPRRKAA